MIGELEREDKCGCQDIGICGVCIIFQVFTCLAALKEVAKFLPSYKFFAMSLVHMLLFRKITI